MEYLTQRTYSSPLEKLLTTRMTILGHENILWFSWNAENNWILRGFLQLRLKMSAGMHTAFTYFNYEQTQGGFHELPKRKNCLWSFFL